jgi:hypothetical protein
VLPRYDQGLVRAADGEPDDMIALAAPIGVGGSLARSIAPRSPSFVTVAADQDVYRFAGVAGRTYVAEVYKRQQQSGRRPPRRVRHRRHAAGVRQLLRLRHGKRVCPGAGRGVLTGAYYLRVRPDTSTKSGTYSIRVLPRYDQGLVRAADGEPDDMIALAAPIGVGGSLARSIAPRSPSFVTVAADQDVYRFAGVAGRTYVAEVYNVSSSLGGVHLDAYDTGGTRVEFDNYCGSGTGNVCARVQVEVSLTGAYYLRVRPDTSTKSGTYSIRVLPRYDQGLRWDVRGEPNDVPALAYGLRPGVAQGHHIWPRASTLTTIAADVDYFRFTAVAGRTYVFEIRDVAASLGSMHLDAYDGSGTRLAFDTYCGSRTGYVCARVQFTTALAGTYFVRVRSASSTTSGTYSICGYDTRAPGCKTSLVLNPSFELDANGDTKPDWWTASPAFTRSTAVRPVAGSYVARMRATNNGTFVVAQRYANVPLVVPFIASSYVQVPATRDAFTFRVQVRWLNAVGATLKVTPVRTYTAPTAGWHRATATAAAPAGTSSAQLELVATSLNATVYVDAVSLRGAR